MNIAVCIKQVPSEIPGKRCMNMYDYSVLETALRMREAMGGCVDVFTMGPAGARDVLREALAFGADSGVLLCDSAFAGADVLATAYTIACGIKHNGAYSIILCGLKSTDGDTAQLGGELARELGVPYIPGICEWRKDDVYGLYAAYHTDGEKVHIKATFPMLLTVDPVISGIRVPTLTERLRSRKKVIPCLNAADIQADIRRTGQRGSATRVVELIEAGDAKQTEPLALTAVQAIQYIQDRKKQWIE